MSGTEIGIGVSLFGVAVTAISGVVWGIRQEGRINAHDQRFNLKDLSDTERHEEMKDRLTRIERKLDSLNGKH